VWGRVPDELDLALGERWIAMMQRCYDSSFYHFNRYGGRGIKVHPDFHKKIDFVNYAKQLPKANVHRSIDRIDNDGDYAPGNIRWATQKEQNRNTGVTIKVSFKGKKIPAKEFAELHVTRFKPQTVTRLAKRGFTGEEILKWESECPRAGVRHRRCRW
jgi:hypothetical protein